MKIDSEELKELIRSTIQSIEEGVTEKYQLKGAIEFNLAVVNVKKAEGGIKLLVVDASGKYSKETISKIRFEIEPTEVRPKRVIY